MSEAEMDALRAAHEQQIRALTDPGLADADRVRMFCAAAGFPQCLIDHRLRMLNKSGSITPAYVCWMSGGYPMSIFANLPGECGCPVVQAGDDPCSMPDLIPQSVGFNWRPDRAVLEEFARVQQAARA